MIRIAAQGKCVFCNKALSKTGLTLHLNNHLTEISKGNKFGKSFHIKIEPGRRWGTTPYFLYFWIDASAEMDDIDNFLRNIWLVCCGHVSSFIKKQSGKNNSNLWNGLIIDSKSGSTRLIEEYNEPEEGEENDDEVHMDKKAKDVLKKGLELYYIYDLEVLQNCC